MQKDKETTSIIGEWINSNGDDVEQDGQNHSESVWKPIRSIKDNSVETVHVYSQGNSTGSDRISVCREFISKTELSQFCRKVNRGESSKTVVNITNKMLQD